MMDVYLRGAIERHVDTILADEVLISTSQMFKKDLTPTVKNLEEALFGYVIGRVVDFSFFAITANYYRSPNNEEYAEIYHILQRRAVEIKSKVTLLAN